MATFGSHYSLGFGDPHGDGLRVLAAGGAVSFIDLAVLAQINKGWQRQVNAWRATVQSVSLWDIEYDRFGLPDDATRFMYNERLHDLCSAADVATPRRHHPRNWCFGKTEKTRRSRVPVGALGSADLAMELILRFYSGLKGLDIRDTWVSAETLLRLPVSCPLLRAIDARGSPAGELYDNYFTEEWASTLDSDSEELFRWRGPPVTWAKPCGLASGVTRQLQESLPNLKIVAGKIVFRVTEGRLDEGGNQIHRDYRLYMNQPLQRVFDAYATRIGVPADQLRFEHYDEQCEWTIVKGDDTPSTIDMDPDIRDLLWARRLPLPPTPGPHTMGDLFGESSGDDDPPEAAEVVAE
jgi:hypothetical protein